MSNAETQPRTGQHGTSAIKPPTPEDFLGSFTSVDEREAHRIFAAAPRHILAAFAALDYYALRIHPRVSRKLDGPGAFFYGIQQNVRMRPLILRIALPQFPPYSAIHITVDPRVSDRLGLFQPAMIGRREWKVGRCPVPDGGLPLRDLQYVVQQFIEAVEIATGSTSRLSLDAVTVPTVASGSEEYEYAAPGSSASPTIPRADSSPTMADVPGSVTFPSAFQVEEPLNKAPVSQFPISRDGADDRNSISTLGGDDEVAEADPGEPIREDSATIRWRDDSHTVHEFCRRYGRGRIELQPEFQRDYVWTPKIARRFIESIFLGLPVPTIYLAETEDNRFLVIDGQQRLQTIVNFHENRFSLSSVSVESLSELQGLLFKDLQSALQDRFEDYRLAVTVLEKSCSPELKFDMFERLNQGSVKLNNQELRNCIYRGPYNKLLSRLSDSEVFLNACGWKSPQRRMKGEEMVLRFFAFHFRNVQSIKTFDGALNEEMRANQFLLADDAGQRERVFRDALSLCVQVFGSNPFRMWVAGRNEADPTGHWEDRLNAVVFEVLMTSFAAYEKPRVVANADAIQEEFIHLLSTDQFMVDSLSLGTNSRQKMRYRHDTWRSALRSLLDTTEREARCFRLTFKRELWQREPTCGICGQTIHSLEDAAVDHVVHYWRGGRTIPANARLAHRFCNSRRGAHE